MYHSIEDFREKFVFSRKAIEDLKISYFNKNKRKYEICGINVYRQYQGFKKPKHSGVWFLDFNKNICWKKNFDYWY